MTHYQHQDYDNRDAGQISEDMEARIDALKRQIVQLEAENEVLRRKVVEVTPSEFWTSTNV
jgi:hypothetical protein